MHVGALKVLEFDRVVEAVRSLALTPLGAERLDALRPLMDRRHVADALAATSEAVRYLAAHPALPLRADAALDGALAALAIENRALDPRQLLALAGFLASVEETRGALCQVDRTQIPILRGIADAAGSFEEEVAEIRAKIADSGEVNDDATPQLRAMRDRLRRLRGRLRTTLESYLRGRETARYLQEQIVTDREGRYVLVVKSEHRTAIPGIVHGSSASGASLFLEPLSTVEVNNEIVALEEQVEQEVLRILLALADRFRRRAADLRRTLGVATELDVVQAKARLSELVEGVEPALSPDGRLELRGARHPLLIPAVVRRLGGDLATGPGDEGRSAVPVDLLVVPPDLALVISGPNTGGKTVALKTAGLLALMGQAGLHIPARAGSSQPVFRSVFADIGDEQSISANLSTFSGHIANVARMDTRLSHPAMVLLDEIGAGTDPAEGGALGMAIIEHFRQREALVIATTHDDALKSYASTTPGVTCAAFGFDPETYAPTYRLEYGVPGRSLAFEIGERLGLPASIIARARASRSERETQLADHLAKVERDLAAIQRDQRLLAQQRQTVSEVEANLQAREEDLRRREDALKRRLDERLGEHLQRAHREIDDIVADVRRRATELSAEASRRAARDERVVSTGETGGLRSEGRTALDDLARRVQAAEDGGDTAAETDRVAVGSGGVTRPTVGDRVRVRSLGLEGTVRALGAHDAEIEVRGKRLHVPCDGLEISGTGGGASAQVSVSVHLQPRGDVATDLNLIGCTVDEALSRAQRFLDEALIGERQTVRVIHGYGTGQLRRAIASFLHDHPLVERFAAAPPDQGGGGVTVVELKE